MKLNLNKSISVFCALLFFAALQGVAQSSFFTAQWSTTSGGAYNNTIASAKMSDGTFYVAMIGSTEHLDLSHWDANGNVLETHQISSPEFQLTSAVNGYALGEDKVIITGMCRYLADSSEYFYAMMVNLVTWEVKTTVRKNLYIEYSKGPKVSISSDGIYVSFPEWRRISLERLDLDFNSQWVRSCQVDTFDTHKTPTMDCAALNDGSACVVFKDETQLSLIFFNRYGHETGRYLLGTPFYFRPFCVRECADGGLLIAGQQSYDLNARGILIKLKPDLTLEWKKRSDYYGSRYVDAQELLDGRIVAFGTDYDGYANNYFNIITLFEPDGDHVSTGHLRDDSTNFFLYDAEVTDNGLLLSGISGISGYYNLSTVINTSLDLGSVCHLSARPPLFSDFTLDSPILNLDTLLHLPIEGGTPASFTAVPGDNVILTHCGVITSSAPANSLTRFSVGPTPLLAGESLALKGLPDAEVTLEWMDVQGRIVRKETLAKGTDQISTVGLPPSLYKLVASTQATRQITDVLILE